jgi:hypothetical protein
VRWRYLTRRMVPPEGLARFINSSSDDRTIARLQHAAKKGFLLFSGDTLFRLHFKIEPVIAASCGGQTWIGHAGPYAFGLEFSRHVNIPVSAIGHSIKEIEYRMSILDRFHPFDQGDLVSTLKLARLSSICTRGRDLIQACRYHFKDTIVSGAFRSGFNLIYGTWQ